MDGITLDLQPIKDVKDVSSIVKMTHVESNSNDQIGPLCIKLCIIQALSKIGSDTKCASSAKRVNLVNQSILYKVLDVCYFSGIAILSYGSGDNRI